jgi:hypothetical protein
MLSSWDKEEHRLANSGACRPNTAAVENLTEEK